MRSRITCVPIALCQRRSPSTAAAPFTDPKLNAGMLPRRSSIGGWVLPEARQLAARSAIGSLALIAAVVAFAAAAFAYTAGWFSPDRLTPTSWSRLHAARRRPAARPSSQPRQGHLLHRSIRGERRRFGALESPGVCARPVPGPRTLQSGHARSERGGRDGPGARPRPQHRDAGRAGMAQRHDQSAVLHRLDAAGVLRAFARFGQQGSRTRCRHSSAPIPSSRSSATGPRARPGPAATRKSGSTASTASSSPTIRARSMRCDGR